MYMELVANLSTNTLKMGEASHEINLKEMFDAENKSTTAYMMTIPTHPASFPAQVTISAVIAFMCLWSTVGNLLTILAVSLHRDMRTKCNLFILSLAVSDLISGLIASPLWLYRRTWGFQSWSWGEFLCKFYWFTDESSSYCTAMHIASFAIWRYIGVKWPHRIEAIKKRSVKIWISVLWITALLFGGVLFSTLYDLAEKDQQHDEYVYSPWPACSIKIADNGLQKHLIYYTTSSTLFMLLPMLILCISSVLIARELFFHTNFKSRSRKSKEKRAICQLALISASFLFGYVPMTTYVMWTTRSRHKDYRTDYWLHIVSYLSLRISECFNPIIYNIASRNMRKASRRILHCIRNCGRSDAEIEFVSNSPANKRQKISDISLRGLQKNNSQRSVRIIAINEEYTLTKNMTNGLICNTILTAESGSDKEES